MNYLSDQTLIRCFLTTHQNHYFAQLYNRYRRRVYKQCLLLCSDPDEAEDYTQEIFLRLTDKLATYRGQAAFTSWLHVVTTNYCRDQLRKRQQRRLADQHYHRHMLTYSLYPESDEQAVQLMEWVVEQLPSYQRELLSLKYEDQVKIKVIAQREKTTLSAIKMRIKRARDQARNRYIQLNAKAV